MMRTVVTLVVALVLLMLAGTAAMAANTDQQTVTYEVQAINEISVSGDPAALIVSAATAGSQPDAATDATTTYSITTNQSNRKITGAINTAMPANTTLSITLAAPTGGSSAGPVNLTALAADLVTGISTLAESAKQISYSFTALTTAGVIASANKTVTLTVTAGS